MKYIILIISMSLIKFESQDIQKLNGKYNYFLDHDDAFLKNGSVIFKDSIYTLNLSFPYGKNLLEKLYTEILFT